MPLAYRPPYASFGTMSDVPAGSWYSTQDQFPTNHDVPQVMTVNHTSFSRDIVVVDGSKFTVSNAGLYNLQFSVQLNNTDGGGSSAHAHIWLKKNGSDVTDSASRVSVVPNSPQVIAAWNFFESLAVGDYLELAFEVSVVGIGLDYETANATPGIPSVIVTMNQVG